MLVASQSLEKLPQAEEPQLLYPRRSLSGFHVLCPTSVDWMKEGTEVGPLRLVGKLEELPLSDWKFIGQEKR